MRPHVLIVEDDEDFVAELMASIGTVSSDVDVSIADCRESACELLAERFFDFAILDLNIPTQPRGLDADPDHGKYVFHHARLTTPGTKILVLTGSPSDDFISDMLKQKHDADIWSEGTKVGTVEFLRKIDLVKVDGIIGGVLTAVAALDDVELDPSGVNLQIGEDRLIRIFAKKFGAARCIVSPITKGRSGAVPFRLQLFDSSGAPIQEAVGKLASMEKVDGENRRYDAHVVLLDPASTPRKMDMLEFGAGTTAGLFYQLAAGFNASVFGALGTDEARAARAVSVTANALSLWGQGQGQSRRTIAELRRCWLPDAKAAELIAQHDLSWATSLEARQIQQSWCCVHGDLHGDNILIDDADRAVLIDFGDVRRSAASYDPITLELSAVLQSNSALSGEWPSTEQCHQWCDLDAYVAGSHIGTFVRECRGWALQRGAGKREIGASAYAYLLRQLKYPDTNKDRILALLEGARGMLQAT